ncbi:MAG: hypothetical protein Q7J64_01020 [Elusimicrobiota bacterium]|nr:hypothetical protein [Elusimicrobiota bacterium]
MKILALLLWLVAFAAPAPAEELDEETRVKIAQYMLKTPLDEADPTLVSGFMKIDTSTLPKKLREKARARQMEIDAVVKIHKGKKKGPFRFPVSCEIKRYEGAEGIRIMGLIIGNTEITQEEEEYLELKGNCTEEQLICEFSLNVVLIKRKDKPTLRRYFMMEQDPLMAWVAEKRGGGASAGNQYFQELKPSCQQSAGGK